MPNHVQNIQTHLMPNDSYGYVVMSYGIPVDPLSKTDFKHLRAVGPSSMRIACQRRVRTDAPLPTYGVPRQHVRPVKRTPPRTDVTTRPGIGSPNAAAARSGTIGEYWPVTRVPTSFYYTFPRLGAENQTIRKKKSIQCKWSW